MRRNEVEIKKFIIKKNLKKIVLLFLASLQECEIFVVD